MKLSKLLERMEYKLVQGTKDIDIKALVYDSRKEPIKDSIFVCIRGSVFDGHDYASDMATKGASVIIAERLVVVPENIVLIYVPDTRLALALLSAAYFDYPAERIKTVGITGTKGKTTTAAMVWSMFQKSGIKTGMIGTIEVIIGDTVIPANNTTPESYLLQEYLYRMVQANCECVVMEVSSQGLMQNRVAGFVFDYGIFTNIEPDHIGPNEHKDFEDYMNCKGLLFKRCKVGILNADDEHMKKVLEGHTCLVETFGTTKEADLYAENIDLHSSMGSMGVTYDLRGLLNFKVKVDIPGRFSVYNSLTAIAIGRHFNISEDIIKSVLTDVQVKGRVERIDISKSFILMIDYAHNAMSLESLLSTLKEYQPKRLICMFGCGGNRSKDRRFEMGEISSRLSDITVVTSDNPRFEEPEAIIDDILVGVKRGGGKYVTISDRKEAIRYCIYHAKDGDVIILAGKGHEDYQEIRGIKYHMDDRELIYEVVQEMPENMKLLDIYLPKKGKARQTNESV